jgi:hypothetical protein
MSNKHLLEACKDKHVNAGRARKVTERKMCNKHLLEGWEVTFKYDEKGRKKGEKARKVTERKKVNMHLLEACKAIYVKEGRTRKVTERKVGNKHLLESCKVIQVKAGRARKVPARKMDNMHLLEVWEATFKGERKGRERARRRGK